MNDFKKFEKMALNVLFVHYNTDVQKHFDVCKDHDCCYVEMSNKDNNILKYNHGEKFMKALFIIYADMESLLEKINTYKKINEHTPSGYSLFTHCSFDNTKIGLVIIEVKTEQKCFVKI